MINIRKKASFFGVDSSSFTLVEVTLAIAVIAIGMVGVLALFPIGFQASRNAVGDNYSSQLVDQTLHIIALQAKSYDEDDSGNVTYNGWADWIDGGSAKLPNDKPSDLEFSASDIETAKQSPLLPACPELGIYKKDSSTYDVYYLESKSGGVVDFSAVLAVWQDPSLIDYSSTTIQESPESGSIPKEYATRLFLEVSWPVKVPYEKREKRLYMLDLFNQNY